MERAILKLMTPRSLYVAISTLLLMGCSISDRPHTIEGGTAGLRNFRVQEATLAALTLVDPTTSSVSNYYNNAKFRLSTDGSANALSATMILAHVGLTGQYCEQFIDDEENRLPEERRALRNFDFSTNEVRLNSTLRHDVIHRFTGLFWRRQATDSEVSELLAAMEEAEIDEQDQNGMQLGDPLNSNQVKDILLVMCASIGGSLDAMIE